MATAELSTTPSSRRALLDVRKTWPRVYTGLWLSTFASALFVELLGPWLSIPVRELLRARLSPRLNASPQIGHVLLLLAHNLPISTWPVLLGVVGAQHSRLARWLADVAVIGSLLVNTACTGAALGAYGIPLLAYVLQLPFEWAGLALGASAWLVQRRQPLRICDGLLIYGLAAGTLLGAAVLETFAVPHR